MADTTYYELASAVLVAHQRRPGAGCLCGWNVPGYSHAEHVATVLALSGALRDAVPNARERRLARALKPFAIYGEGVSPGLSSEVAVVTREDVVVTVGDFREARRVMDEAGEGR